MFFRLSIITGAINALALVGTDVMPVDKLPKYAYTDPYQHRRGNPDKAKRLRVSDSSKGLMGVKT